MHYLCKSLKCDVKSNFNVLVGKKSSSLWCTVLLFDLKANLIDLNNIL